MPMSTGRARPGGPQAAPRVALIAALAVERAGLASGDGAAFHQSGPGAARAGAAARAAVAGGAAAIVSWGFAGGLAAALAAGDVVLPVRIVGPGGAEWLADARWHAALAAGLAAALGARARIHVGALVCVAHVLESPRAKLALAETTGAVAADMESAAVAAVAAEHGLPFAAVRVVADTSADTLPADVGEWVDAAGHRKLMPVLGAAIRPLQWPALLTIAARYRLARRTLAAAARHLATCDYCVPAEPAQARRR